MASLRRLVKPDRGLTRIFRDALSVVVEQPDDVDRLGLALGGRTPVPVDSLAVVLRHVGAVFVDPAKGKLRGQVADVARGADGGQRRAGRGVAPRGKKPPGRGSGKRQRGLWVLPPSTVATKPLSRSS